MLADGEGVEERLRGVLVRAVARVDDAALEEAGEEVRRAGGAVPDDDDVGVEGLEVARGVLEGLAFLERAGLDAEVDDIGAEADGGQLEADARARAGLDEEVDDGLAAQGGNFLDGALADGFELPGGVEDGDDFVRRKGLDVEEVFTVPDHAQLTAGGWSNGAVEGWKANTLKTKVRHR